VIFDLIYVVNQTLFITLYSPFQKYQFELNRIIINHYIAIMAVTKTINFVIQTIINQTQLLLIYFYIYYY